MVRARANGSANGVHANGRTRHPHAVVDAPLKAGDPLPPDYLPPDWTLVAENPADQGGGWFVLVPTEQVVKMVPHYNPPARSDPKSVRNRLREMGESLDRHGVCQPPLITLTTLVDGTRRAFAWHAAGKARMLCLLMPWADAATFAALTHHQLQHLTAERCWTYRQNPAAVHPRDAKPIRHALDTMGEELFDYILGERLNPMSVLTESNAATQYVYGKDEAGTDEGRDFLVRCCRFCAELRQQQAVRQHRRRGKGPLKLKWHVDNGVPLPKDEPAEA